MSIEQLWQLPESQRNKGTRLLCKIFTNLLDNLTESEKYGNLNLRKIRGKLIKCKPAFQLLLAVGFKQSTNGERLIWQYNNDSLMLLKNAYTELKAKVENKLNDKL
eukprot:56945_1